MIFGKSSERRDPNATSHDSGAKTPSPGHGPRAQKQLRLLVEEHALEEMGVRPAMRRQVRARQAGSRTTQDASHRYERGCCHDAHKVVAFAMAMRVVMTAQGRADFEKLPLTIRVSGARAMRGRLAGHHRIRTGDWSVVFTVSGDVIVVRIQHRSTVYDD